MKKTSLTPFFQPVGIVLSGVSQDPAKLGYALARNLVKSGYKGAVHFVNPRGGRLFEREIFASIRQVPDPVDLAVLLVPPAAILQALADVAARGIKAAIIATGGFKETGPEGAALEAQAAEFARLHQIRLVGPNCVGLINTHYPFDTSFLQPPGPPAGEIAFLSNSGAICAAVIDWIRGEGAGLSHLMSLGNQADVCETDLLADVAADVHTRALTLYMESVKDGRRFVEVASRVTRLKPVVALKVGRSDSGKRAAASHTGALAGAEAAYDAAFDRGGVLRAETTEQMFQWARALAWCPLPAGKRVAVLTNSGGPGVTAADAIEKEGLALADLSDTTRTGLRQILPAAASLANPVDMLASATPDHFSGCLRLLLEDENVDMVVVISPPPPPATIGGVVKAMLPIIQTYPHKPVVMALMGSSQIGEGVSLLHAAQIPDYRFPEAAVSALGALNRYSQYRRTPPEPVLRPGRMQREKAGAALAACQPGQWIGQDELLDILSAYRIPVLMPVLAQAAGELKEAARKAGYPLVLKLASPDIAHKSDIGGVLVGITDGRQAARGFETILERVKQARPDARVDGVTVQRMAPEGQEVICGFVRDPQFGPLMMFGSGGVEVEGLKDVAFGLAPLSRADAERMLSATWAGKKLAGFRHLAAADREAVIDVLVRISYLALDLPEITELEINPLRVLPAGQGALALDVRAKL